jgi:hypothetical protein
LVVSELEPPELPEPMLPEPDPPVLEPPVLEPLLPAPVLGVGDAGLAPLAPVPALDPALSLLKWASHSEREIWPSLFVSTAEKLGAEALDALPEPDKPPPELELVPPDAALPPEDDVPDEPLDMPDEPLDELPPAAEGDDDEGLSALVLLDEELCASATLESANSAAAVAALKTLSFNIG